jgi:hypothetical protein
MTLGFDGHINDSLMCNYTAYDFSFVPSLGLTCRATYRVTEIFQVGGEMTWGKN